MLSYFILRVTHHVHASLFLIVPLRQPWPPVSCSAPALMPFSIDLKGAKNLVTELDLASEALIVEMILPAFPIMASWLKKGTIRPVMAACLDY
jgi:hypothetical protein